MTPEFIPFPKIARLSRLAIVSEKIDGTNAQVLITEDGDIFAGSRSRWITPEDDNYGFARWVEGNKDTLLKLGPGRHMGEWWGCLSSDTSVRLADGTLERIGRIVNKKLGVEVLSYNFDTQKIEPRRVVGWKRGPATDDWLTIIFKRKFRGGRKLRLHLTPNHIIYRSTDEGYEEVPAGQICAGDRLFLGFENPSCFQQQIISGSLMGDGSVQDHCFGVGHSNHALVDTKIKLLENLVASTSFVISGHGSLMKKLQTKTLPFLRDIEEEIYVNGIKGVTTAFVNTFGPVAFAFWYVDDGHIAFSSVRSPICELSTRGFSEDSVRAVSETLRLRGYENYVFLAKDMPVIRFTPKGTRRFQLDISPYIPWEMKYKMLPAFREIIPAWEQVLPEDNVGRDLVTTEVVSVTDDYLRGGRSKVRYDIEVEGNNNFFANGVLVHNSGINRNYGLKEKRFSLFNTVRWCNYGDAPQRIPMADPRIEKWQEALPEGLRLVPKLRWSDFSTRVCDEALDNLREYGSLAAPGFMRPEGIVVFHVAANTAFKRTLEKDGEPKSRT